MKRLSACVVLVSFLPATVFAQVPVSSFRQSLATWRPSAELLWQTVQAPPCDDSRVQGRAAAEAQHSSLGWFAGGIGAGAGAGFIGTGVITAIPAFGSPQPKTIPPNQNEACYREGYKGKAKSKNVLSALLGGALGTAAFIGIWYVAMAED